MNKKLINELNLENQKQTPRKPKKIVGDFFFSLGMKITQTSLMQSVTVKIRTTRHIR